MIGGWLGRRIPWGTSRSLTPVSRVFGLDRGQPIDRYYIESFLGRYENDIRGRVLEIGDATYTRRFGGDRVAKTDVLHAKAGNPEATLVGDLTTGEGIPRNSFDCLVLTQTFNVTYDVAEAVAQSYNALAPGGVVLATLPGISQVSRYDMDRWGDFWRFTDAAAKRVFGTVFGMGNVTVATYGNVFAACAFLQGLAVHELGRDELDLIDPDYQLLISVRARKPVFGERLS